MDKQVDIVKDMVFYLFANSGYGEEKFNIGTKLLLVPQSGELRRAIAPIIDKFPVTLECRVVEMQKQPYGLRVLGQIVGVLAEDRTFDAKGKVDASKLDAFLFDQFQNRYYAIGEDIGGAWDVSKELLK